MRSALRRRSDRPAIRDQCPGERQHRPQSGRNGSPSRCSTRSMTTSQLGQTCRQATSTAEVRLRCKAGLHNTPEQLDHPDRGRNPHPGRRRRYLRGRDGGCVAQLVRAPDWDLDIAGSIPVTRPSYFKLRSGNVHSADGWRGVLEPVIARYRCVVKRRYFRGDAPPPTPRYTSSLKPRASATRPGCRPTVCCKAGSGTGSGARPGGRRTRCAAAMPISAIRRRAGANRAVPWPRSGGIPASSTRVSALS
jgi:hypothetical protein